MPGGAAGVEVGVLEIEIARPHSCESRSVSVVGMPKAFYEHFLRFGRRRLESQPFQWTDFGKDSVDGREEPSKQTRLLVISAVFLLERGASVLKYKSAPRDVGDQRRDFVPFVAPRGLCKRRHYLAHRVALR